MRVLCCIYTCKEDFQHLEALKKTKLFDRIRHDDRFQTLEVYADSRLSKPRLAHGVLVIDCHEDYSKLSLKTYKMIDLCLNIEFDYLLKIDCTLLDHLTAWRQKAKMQLGHWDHNLVEQALFEGTFFDKEYNGLINQAAKEPGFNKWARAKNVRTHYRKVFKVGEPTPYYYTGPLYSMSRQFCEFIARHGHHMAVEHVKYLGGSEDLMIGRLYNQYTTDSR